MSIVRLDGPKPDCRATFPDSESHPYEVYVYCPDPFPEEPGMALFAFATDGEAMAFCVGLRVVKNFPRVVVASRTRVQ